MIETKKQIEAWFDKYYSELQYEKDKDLKKWYDTCKHILSVKENNKDYKGA